MGLTSSASASSRSRGSSTPHVGAVAKKQTTDVLAMSVATAALSATATSEGLSTSLRGGGSSSRRASEATVAGVGGGGGGAGARRGFDVSAPASPVSVSATTTAAAAVAPPTRTKSRWSLQGLLFRGTSTKKTHGFGKKKQLDRIMSCPDMAHHFESDLVARLSLMVRSMTSTETETAVETEQQQQRTNIFNGPDTDVTLFLAKLVSSLGDIVEVDRALGFDKDVRSDLAVRYIVFALVLLERLAASSRGVRPTPRNTPRLILAGVVVAAKILDDVQPRPEYLAKISGLPVKLIAALEWALVETLEYRVVPSVEEWERMYARVLRVASIG